MKPLEKKIIISTRPIAEDDTIKSALTDKGAVVLDFPMIKIVTNELNSEINSTFANLETFNWFLFTSKNGVDSFFRILTGYSSNITIKTPKIAVIGRTTANEVLKNGYEPDYISRGNTSDDFIEDSKKIINPTDNILLIQGELANSKLENELAIYTNVKRLNVYKTVYLDSYSTEIVTRIMKKEYDLLLFTSPSGVENFAKIMALNNCNDVFKIACIGKTTETAALELGYTPLIVSKKTDGYFFSNEIETYFKK